MTPARNPIWTRLGSHKAPGCTASQTTSVTEPCAPTSSSGFACLVHGSEADRPGRHAARQCPREACRP
eukprot:CAMPEP_0204376702 /NCGR_PEP_ID=MMETSP0469-20131031/50310_1 /ASSEMBLY_ACC=CAM_ASM_000384 /TAXON_ID=2969 /ORGANISM="Oxyrrhis marina" /LENGTH=67 /DNA_ID=CAMNT_0051367619 /DNA_START=180 /DNA_END=380 /DNA_ORIENTATION=-